jgi:hypothetical protein
MTIYIHIGSHKTGTTSIQRYLSRHRDTLGKQGIWYPHISELLANTRNSTSHLNIARSLERGKRGRLYSEAELTEMFKALVAKSKNFDSTILSAEAFWRIGFLKPPENSEERDEYEIKTWKNKADSIARIRNLLGDTAHVHIVAALRERSAYLQSSYSEFILATQWKKNIKNFLGYIQHVSDYKRQLEAWQVQFPIITLSYESLCEQRNLPVSFIREIVGQFNDPSAMDEEQKIHNPSHPIACVFFKRYLNRLSNVSVRKRNTIYDKALRLFKRSSDNKTVKSLQSINSWLSAREVRSLRLKYIEEDNFIRSHFCKDFVSGTTKALSNEQAHLVPMAKDDEYLCLGWMLSKTKPDMQWFSTSCE